jgi:hypothetical protein
MHVLLLLLLRAGHFLSRLPLCNTPMAIAFGGLPISFGTLSLLLFRFRLVLLILFNIVLLTIESLRGNKLGLWLRICLRFWRDRNRRLDGLNRRACRRTRRRFRERRQNNSRRWRCICGLGLRSFRLRNSFQSRLSQHYPAAKPHSNEQD